MDLEQLKKKMNQKGFIFLYTSAITFVICIAYGIPLFNGIPHSQEYLYIIKFLTSMVATLILFYFATKYWPFGDEDIIVVKYKDIIYLAEIINGSPCKIYRIELIRKNGGIKRKDIYFSFKENYICIQGIDFIQSKKLNKDNIFSMAAIPSKNGKSIQVKIEKIV